MTLKCVLALSIYKSIHIYERTHKTSPQTLALPRDFSRWQTDMRLRRFSLQLAKHVVVVVPSYAAGGAAHTPIGPRDVLCTSAARAIGELCSMLYSYRAGAVS